MDFIANYRYIIIILIIQFFLINWILISYGANKRHYGFALWELFVTWTISNIPIGWLIFIALSRNSNSEIFTILDSNIRAEEVFIYISAIFAPILYSWGATLDKRTRTWHILIIALFFACFSGSIYYYSNYKLNIKLDRDFANKTAILIYMSSLLCWYGTLIFKRQVENLPEFTDHSNEIISDLRGSE